MLRRERLSSVRRYARRGGDTMTFVFAMYNPNAYYCWRFYRDGRDMGHYHELSDWFSGYNFVSGDYVLIIGTTGFGS